VGGSQVDSSAYVGWRGRRVAVSYPSSSIYSQAHGKITSYPFVRIMIRQAGNGTSTLPTSYWFV
jgi:hypothetical protein